MVRGRGMSRRIPVFQVEGGGGGKRQGLVRCKVHGGGKGAYG